MKIMTHQIKNVPQPNFLQDLIPKAINPEIIIINKVRRVIKLNIFVEGKRVLTKESPLEMYY